MVLCSPSPAQIIFIPGPQLPVSAGPTYVATADINGDGIADAVISDTIAAQVQVLLSCNPAKDPTCDPGTFTQPFGLPVGRTLRGIATLDYNSDRKADIAVVDFSLANVFAIAGKGDGTFSAPVPFNTALRGPIAIAVGNFDDQNGPDLVTANGPANTITTLFNQGSNRGFAAQPNIPVGKNPRAVATADFNSDGLDDIAVVNTGIRGADQVGILLDKSIGSFQSVIPVNYVVGTGAKAIVVSDFNNDGVPDLAVLNAGGSVTSVFSISILLDRTTKTQQGTTIGTGLFTVLPAFSITCPQKINGIQVTCTPQDIEAADFDRDGFNDLAVSFSTKAVNNTSVTAGFVSAFAGRGDGTFDFGTQVVVGLGPRGLAAADVTGDRLPDLIVAEFGNNTVRVLKSVAPEPKTPGSPCNLGTQCASGFCVDHVCCESSSCPTGQSCNVSPNQGVCSVPGPIGIPCTSGTQCQSGQCVDGFCCASASCPSGNFCNTGVCSPPADNGANCSLDEQCASGHCVDGICCDSEACPVGEFCNIPGFAGMCTPPEPQGSPCTVVEQCQTGLFCTDHFCCDQRICPAGMTCDNPGSEGTCAIAPTFTPTATRTPSPTLTPTPQPNGASCTNNSQCASQQCVIIDSEPTGTCCNSASCPDDQRCDIIGHLGMCASKLPNPAVCAKNTDCVSGNCQGNVCVPPFTPTQTPTPTQTQTPTPVGPGGTCTLSSQCTTGFVCNTSETPHVCCTTLTCPVGQKCSVPDNLGVCSTPPTPTPTPTPKRALATPCAGDSQCQSGFCTDGVCCEEGDCTPDLCNITGDEGFCVPCIADVGVDCGKNSDCCDPLVCRDDPALGKFVCDPPPTFSPTPPVFATPTTPVPADQLVVGRSGGCSIGRGDTGNGLWMLGALPIIVWVRRYGLARLRK
jgi:VCBS repeat protein